MSTREFVKSLASFSWALSVFGVSQAGKVFRGLPTANPTQRASESFQVNTSTLKAQFDANDNTLFNAGNTVQNALIDLTFNFFTPNTFNPRTILETSQNVLKWGIGLATQLIPGGRIGTGGPPKGWGPVNNEGAELQLPNVQLPGVQPSSPQPPSQGRSEPDC